MPVVGAIRQWYATTEEMKRKPKNAPAAPDTILIDHYLLLPSYKWGIADWHLDVIRPYIKKYAPTVGFSVGEACRSAHVTVVGNENDFSAEELQLLKTAACPVEWISGDGTNIASQLIER